MEWPGLALVRVCLSVARCVPSTNLDSTLMWPTCHRGLIAALSSAAAGLVLLVTVFATGQTFGQRCRAAGHLEDSRAWADCVASMTRGDFPCCAASGATKTIQITIDEGM